ncbi:hypothetical protein DL769_002960 [Monosporascus sp. CRB-8-3]|nr:hypothetical protein DL769_002960 [Monosporascus sp. CRB-8-3]
MSAPSEEASRREMESRRTPTKPRQAAESSWFKIPAPLARLFKKFPLLTYPPNELPARSPKSRDVATLYVFISDQGALRGLPSFNPSCLKWQAFLRLAGVDFRVVSSNNHASPTGALPFLIPPAKLNDPKSQTPIASNKLEQWGLENGTSKLPDVPSRKLEAYEALLDHRIRAAWLYTLYLSPLNSGLLSHLYVAPNSASQIVRTTILYQLRHAAETEITKSSGKPAVNPTTIYHGAREAFEALAVILGSDPWFFKSPEPSLFDATLFSYTHLIVDGSLGWGDRRLNEIVQEFPSLVQHRDRMLQRCWPSLA